MQHIVGSVTPAGVIFRQGRCCAGVPYPFTLIDWVDGVLTSFPGTSTNHYPQTRTTITYHWDFAMAYTFSLVSLSFTLVKSYMMYMVNVLDTYNFSVGTDQARIYRIENISGTIGKESDILETWSTYNKE